jgi:hypothetical protein
VADGFGKCQLFFRGIRRRDEEGVYISPGIHNSKDFIKICGKTVITCPRAENR